MVVTWKRAWETQMAHHLSINDVEYCWYGSKAILGHETGLNAAAATENATATAMKKTDENSQLSERRIDYVETMPFDEDFKGGPAALPTLDTEVTMMGDAGSSLLLGLPSEIHLEIFKHLDAASSTCLALASRRFYPIHRAIHETVPLSAWCILPPNRMSGKHLFELLRSWMPAELEFFSGEMKFLTREKMRDRHKMMSRTLIHVAKMRCIQQQANAWKESGGWYENGVWQTLFIMREKRG